MALITRNFLLLWLATTTTAASGFVVLSHLSTTTTTTTTKPLAMTEDSNNMDAIRRMLEGSWNEDVMGKIPDTPEAAAAEAGTSMLAAIERGHELLVVNLLLPTYDITQGSSLYDEVEAVNFCVALGKFLEAKACIVVRDNKTKNTVTRVLERREASATAEAAAVMKREFVEDEDINDDDEEEEGEDDEDETDNNSATVGDSGPSDDDNGPVIGEFGSKGDTRLGDTTKSEMSNFRKQLMEDWGDLEEIEDGEMQPPSPAAEVPQSALPPGPREKQYRVTSMFGDATFTSGPDMFDNVIQAVSANAQPKEDEDTLIILSAASMEETIGVRALAAKYKQSKTIVLVNCHFEPVPVEIIKAETVYSLLPLAAKQKQQASGSDSYAPVPKVVVLRRYPRDFEVFMDFGKGSGFELTESVSTEQVGKRGPSLQWIADRLKQQMDARFL